MSTLTGQTQPGAGQGDNTSGAGSGDGNQTVTDWRSALPEELRGEASLESIKGKDWSEAGPTLVKGYINAQKLVGAEKIVLPTKDSTPEQIAEFRKKLGVPEKPEDYAVTLPEGITEDKLDKALVDTWRKRLHEVGVPKAQAERIIGDYLKDNAELLTAAQKAQEQQHTQWELELKQKYGTNYDKQVNLARHALETFKDPALIAWLDETGAGNHPAVVDFFAKVGNAISDDSVRTGSQGSRGDPQTAAAAEAELNAMNTNEAEQKALWDKNHPQHDAVVAKRAKLFKMAYPSDSDE